MVYVIIARGKGLIREDSCNLYKEWGIGAAQKAFVTRICFARRSSRFPKTPGIRTSFIMHLVPWKAGRFPRLLCILRRTLISMFHETFITSWLQESLGCHCFDFILAPYFKSGTRNFVHARNDRWRKNSSSFLQIVDGDVDVGESFRLRMRLQYVILSLS